MTIYESVAYEMQLAKKLIKHVERFGKFRAETEDPRLHALLDRAMAEVNMIYTHSKAGKAVPLCLDGTNIPSCQALYGYCLKMAGSKKPEWQVLAERHGWTPPTTKP